MVSSEELLPQAVLRQIGDKLYEKRKVAALEVEQIVKRLAAAGDHARIRLIIDKLIAEYSFSPQANYRKVCVILLLLCVSRSCTLLQHAGDRSRSPWRALAPSPPPPPSSSIADRRASSPPHTQNNHNNNQQKQRAPCCASRRQQ